MWIVVDPVLSNAKNTYVNYLVRCYDDKQEKVGCKTLTACLIPVDTEEAIVEEMSKTVTLVAPANFKKAIDYFVSNGQLKEEQCIDDYMNSPLKWLLDIYDCLQSNLKIYRILAIFEYNIKTHKLFWNTMPLKHKMLYVKIICIYCSVENTIMAPLMSLIEHGDMWQQVYLKSKYFSRY